MSAQNLQDLIVNIIARTSGQKQVEELQRLLVEMGIDAEKAAPMAAKLAAEMDGLAAAHGRAGKSGMDLVGSLKILAGSLIVREFVQANASAEAMAKSLELVMGGSDAAAREMEFVRAEADRLGLNIQNATSAYIQLTAASKGTALEGQATREIWVSVAESMARLGKSTADTDGALLAIGQMMSKGTVQAEELRGQLGERLPGAFQVAARAMNVSTQELGKMLEQGKIVAADFLPRFAEALRRTGGAGGDIETFNARLNRLWSSMKEGAQALNDTVPLFDGLSWVTGKTGAAIGLMTSYLAIAKAGLTGNQEAVEKYAARIDSAGRALFGMGQQAGATGDELTGMASQAEGASRSLASQIGDALVSAMVRLRGEVKTTDDALKNLGVDPEKIRTGVSAAERVIIESFKRLAADPAIDGQVLLGSLLMALDQVGKEAIPEIAFAYKAASRAGKQSADEQIAGLGAIKSALDEVPAGLNQLEAAYKSLGIQSQAALDAQAAKLKEAYDLIVKSGAPLAVQQQAWAKYAEAVIAANGGIATSALQAEAATRGYIIVVDEAGQANIRLKKVVEDFGDAAEQAGRRAQAAMAQAAADSARVWRETYGGTGTMQQSINDFYAHLARLQQVNAEHAERVADRAAQAYADAVRQVSEMGGEASAIFAVLWEKTWPSVRNTNEWFRALEDTVRATSAQVRGLQADMEELSARDTLDTLLNEWDEMNNRLVEIEERRAATRKREILAELEVAMAQGNQAAVAAYQRALDILDRITQARTQEAHQRERENKQNGDVTTYRDTRGGLDTGSARPSFAPVIHLNNSLGTVEDAARLLIPELERIYRLRS